MNLNNQDREYWYFSLYSIFCFQKSRNIELKAYFFPKVAKMKCVAVGKSLPSLDLSFPTVIQDNT